MRGMGGLGAGKGRWSGCRAGEEEEADGRGHVGCLRAGRRGERRRVVVRSRAAG
jgi:hypothetical protein